MSEQHKIAISAIIDLFKLTGAIGWSIRRVIGAFAAIIANFGHLHNRFMSATTGSTFKFIGWHYGLLEPI